MIINHYLDISVDKKIIFIGYYQALGLSLHINVFMILHLYMKLYGYDQQSINIKRGFG